MRFGVKTFFDLSHVAEAGHLLFVFAFDFCLFGLASFFHLAHVTINVRS